MRLEKQGSLFPEMLEDARVADAAASTFTKNLSLPVHRWFRYSAGFSAEWAEQVIREHGAAGRCRVFDPFAGSATTLLAAEIVGSESVGVDSHPFVARIARAKLAWRSSPDEYRAKIERIQRVARDLVPAPLQYPPLIHKCYDEASLESLDRLRRALELVEDETPACELAWLTLVAILRKCSQAGTAPWQYVLPKKKKGSPREPFQAFEDCARMFFADIRRGQQIVGPRSVFHQGDARTCDGVPPGWADLVVTSPPYPNNYDYADAVRLEMSFLGEIQGWGELQDRVRRHLVRSCSQHVPEHSMNLADVLAAAELTPIAPQLAMVCEELAEVRKTKGGRKTYHLMVAGYFQDLARVWIALRRVCVPDARVCFVVGDSAPYGVYVPVIPWLGELALAAGFKSYRFERTRARNIKWKNRKHRVPLQEGRLWVEG